MELIIPQKPETEVELISRNKKKKAFDLKYTLFVFLFYVVIGTGKDAP